VSSINHKLSLQLPAYYAPDDRNIHHKNKDSLAARIFYTAIPFIALHKPFGRAITLTMDAARNISSLSQLMEKKNYLELFKTVISILALAGTIFMHPLGLCIATVYNLGCELTSLLIKAGNLTLFSSCQHLFYLGTMLSGGVEMVAVSLLLSMIVEIARARKEFQEGRFLETGAHLLMSVVRGAQSLPILEKVAYKHNVPGKEYFRSCTETIEKVRDCASIFFYTLARSFVNPLWKSTDLWLQTISVCKNPECSTSQKAFAVAKSTFLSCALFPFTLSGLVLGQTAHFTAFNLASKPYIHLQGAAEAQKASVQSLSVFQLNCCLTAGGFARLFGGLEMSDTERANKIGEMIKNTHPDLVCLTEVSDLPGAFTLYNKLSPEYAEFYFHMGATPFILQNNSGLFIASKEAISRPEFHSFSDIPGTESMVNKGFFSFSTKAADFINTHLSPSSDDLNPKETEISTREEEQSKIFEVVKKRFSENQKPAFVMGDFNTNRGVLFDNSGNKSSIDPKAASQTQYLIHRNWHHNSTVQPEPHVIDYFLSFFHNQSAIQTSAIATFHPNHPEMAISDHPALLSQVTL
jgi:hypothetical protein